jgi:hypothetical protein
MTGLIECRNVATSGSTKYADTPMKITHDTTRVARLFCCEPLFTT